MVPCDGERAPPTRSTDPVSVDMPPPRDTGKLRRARPPELRSCARRDANPPCLQPVPDVPPAPQPHDLPHRKTVDSQPCRSRRASARRRNTCRSSRDTAERTGGLNEEVIRDSDRVTNPARSRIATHHSEASRFKRSSPTAHASHLAAETPKRLKTFTCRTSRKKRSPGSPREGLARFRKPSSTAIWRSRSRRSDSGFGRSG